MRGPCGGASLAAAVALVLQGVVTAGRAAGQERADQPPAAFQPGDISIGEPIALPFAQRSSTPTVTPQTTPQPQPIVTALPGWLGMAVAESASPGRWAIVEVTPAGPAAAAGIVTGDELRGVNGRPLASGEDVSGALTAITAGQAVRLSIARAEQVSDVDVVAMPRPSTTATAPAAPFAPPSSSMATPAATLPATGPAGRGWQSSVETPAPPAAAAADGVATVSVLTNPPATSSPTPPVSPPALAVAAPAAVMAASPRGRTALGVRTMPIDRGLQERFHLPQPSGAYVIGVVGDLPASKAGIPPGSVIVSLADRPVRSPQELTQLVAAGPTDRPLPLRYVLPGGTEKRADVVLQSLELPLEQALIGPAMPQPAAAPQLDPSPPIRTSRRAETPSDGEAGELRREVGRLRALLEAVERRLERLGSR